MTKQQMQAQITSLQGQIQQLSTALEAVKTQFNQINTPTAQDLLQDLETTHSHPPPNNTANVNRRLRIHVPTPEGEVGTTLGMGQKLDNLNYDGFGVDTSGAVSINARGGQEKSSMSLLANGPFLVQSDLDSLYLVSGASSVFASGDVANVAGSGGVVIAAGGMGTDIVNPSIKGKTPEKPTATARLPPHMKNIFKFWSYADAAVAGVSIGRNIVENGLSAPTKKKWATSLLNIGNLVAAGNVTNNVLGAHDILKDDGSVTIHGTSGWLMGTPRFGSLYAGAGLTIGSFLPTIIGLKDAEMVAVHNSKVTSFFNATVEAGKRAELISRRETELAARLGELKITAPYIRMGEFTPEGPTQRPTDHLRINSNMWISLTTDPAATNRLFPEGIHLDSKEVLIQRAEKKILVSSKEEVEVKVSDDTSIKIKSEGNTITIKAKNALIRLSPDNCIELTAAAGGGVVVRRDEIWAGFGESSKVHVTRSGKNKITGNKIDLG